MLRNLRSKITKIFTSSSSEKEIISEETNLEQKASKNEEKKLTPEEEALWTLSQNEGLKFTGLVNGMPHFMHHTGQFGGPQPFEKINSWQADIEKAIEFFEEQKNAGVTEVNVPKDMPFHPLSGRFVDITEDNAGDRIVLCNTNVGVCITKEKLDISVILETLLETKEQFSKAIEAKPDKNLNYDV